MARKELANHFLQVIIPLFCLLSVVFLIYANQVDDLDLWFHLKTGEQISQTLTIPNQDLLAHTTYTPESIINIGKDEVPSSALPSDFPYWSINLGHSWMGQALFFLAYKMGNIRGVAYFKSFIFVMTYFFLYLAMRRRGAGTVSSFLVLCLVAYIGFNFNFSRPQILSFLLFTLLFYLLSDYSSGGKLFYLLWLVMLVWANIHGGFILGVAVLMLFTTGEACQLLLSRVVNSSRLPPGTESQLKPLVLITIVSSLASLLNPNGYRVFLFPWATKNSLYGSFIEEYTKPMLYEYHGYWFMLGLVCLVALIRLKRLRFSDILILAFLAISSQLGIRAIIFFALGSAVFLAYSLSDIMAWLQTRKFLVRFFRAARFSQFSVTGFFISIAALTLLVRTVMSGDILAFNTQEYRYPVKALEFIRQEKLPGPLFNYYDWGGYMIWNLPGYPVFIDGRCLNENILFHYKQILLGVRGKGPDEPLWQRLIDAYNIQFFVIPALSNQGKLWPLVDNLSRLPAWQLIYQDGTTLIFLRDSRKNRFFFSEYYLPKRERILNQIISESLRGIANTPATWGYYETLGNVYLLRYEIDKAKEMFTKYLSMNPFNADIRQKLYMLEEMSGDPRDQNRSRPALPFHP